MQVKNWIQERYIRIWTPKSINRGALSPKRLFFRFLTLHTLKTSVPNQLRHNSLTIRPSSYKTKGSNGLIQIQRQIRQRNRSRRLRRKGLRKVPGNLKTPNLRHFEMVKNMWLGNMDNMLRINWVRFMFDTI